MIKYKILLQNLIMGGVIPGKVRSKLLKLFGHHVSSLYPGCKFGLGKGHLYMGIKSYCNYGCFFDLGESIYIGNNVAIGMNVKFITSSHEIGQSSRRASTPIRKPIYVGDGSWIGADTIILPGVKIGKGVVVGAGSLITRDLDDNCLYVGRPVYKIKELEYNET